MEKKTIMDKIRLEKVTLNCGTGTDQARLEKAVSLLKIITNHQPIKTVSTKRIPTFDIRPGLAIGCKVTIRGEEATELLKKLLETIDNALTEKQMIPGSVSFGIKEYIEIPGIEFQRNIGIMGFEVCVTLTKPGLGIKKKKIGKRKIPKRKFITKEETIKFMKENFNVEIIEKRIK